MTCRGGRGYVVDGNSGMTTEITNRAAIACLFENGRGLLLHLLVLYLGEKVHA